jgi:DNA-binding LacI/PurR family transcriptional regulator
VTPVGQRNQRSPTIRDVAERAGVSKSLVSLVMRGAPQVSDERRDAVHRAAEDLGYRPNDAARSLVRKRSFVIGVVLADLHNPYYAEVVDGIEEAARTAGYRVLINTGDRTTDGEAAAVETMLQMQADALILTGSVLPGPRIEEAAASVPVALVARASRSPSVDSVTNDDRKGAGLAVDHLVAIGHRRIAHIDGARGAGAAGRRSGYVDAMRRHGLGSKVRVATGAYTEEGGVEGAERLLSSGEHPTAVFASNDMAAIGALHALEGHGLRVPEDVSLVGYDNTALSALAHVDLTTIDQPRRHMGSLAVQLVLGHLDGSGRRSRHVVVEPHLVVRRTSAPPRMARRQGEDATRIRTMGSTRKSAGRSARGYE